MTEIKVDRARHSEMLTYDAEHGDGAWMRRETEAEAARLWRAFSDSERWGVAFGILPHAKTPDPMPHALVCALMDYAKTNAPPNVARPLRRRRATRRSETP